MTGVGEAWKEPATIYCSENGKVHIESFEDYQFPIANEISKFQLESKSNNKDHEDKDNDKVDNDFMAK